MKRANNRIGFGFFRGMEYRDGNDLFEDYKQYHNTLPKETIAAHIRGLPVGVAGFQVTDIFTGKEDGVGAIYVDGPFTFPVQFLHYFEEYDIGIPPEYEEYLIRVVGLQ